MPACPRSPLSWSRSLMPRLSLALAVSSLAACTALQGPAQAPAGDAGVSAPASAVVPAAAAASQPEPVAPKTAPGEAALTDGLKSYQAGQYRQAESQLTAALKAGLTNPSDLVAAHKHLAFIYCTSKRDTMCAAEFKAAKAADPAFALSKAEAGHPMWAKTYKRALGLK